MGVTPDVYGMPAAAAYTLFALKAELDGYAPDRDGGLPPYAGAAETEPYAPPPFTAGAHAPPPPR